MKENKEKRNKLKINKGQLAVNSWWCSSSSAQGLGVKLSLSGFLASVFLLIEPF